ncbi:MAG: M48 family metalloprotease [Candidatus Hydrogenedentota bacterium]
MWEQIQSNKRKTWILVFGMALVLLGLGAAIGEFAAPGGGWLFGLLVAFIIWLVMASVAWFKGDNILLMMSGAQKIEYDDHPTLYNVVEEMKIASGLDKMPAVYVVNDLSPNAFAVGRDPDKAAVAVTAGLLGRLDRDELQGVIAHEIGHIVNRDVLLMTMLATTLGTVSIISEIFLRSLWYGGATRRYSSRSKSSSNNGQAQMIMMVVAIVFAILAPLAARLIYMAVSRKREYLADAQASVFTRYPEGLASALEKISSGSEPVEKASKATAAMYIINPFKKASLSSLTATHPPAEDRIRILRGIGNIASYGAYQQAWQSVGGRSKAVGLPKSSLRDDQESDVRKATPGGKKSQRDQLREAGDLMRKFNDFLFLSCACGMRFKIPPEYKHDAINCPKCHRTNPVPTAQIAAAADAITKS